MNAIIATTLFLAALIIHGAGVHPPVWLDWQSLMLAGFFCLSLSSSGEWIGDWQIFRRRGER